jgi:hypothetical protein
VFTDVAPGVALPLLTVDETADGFPDFSFCEPHVGTGALSSLGRTASHVSRKLNPTFEFVPLGRAGLAGAAHDIAPTAPTR